MYTQILLGYADTYMPLLTLIVFLLLRKKIDKRDRCFSVYLVVNVVVFAVTNVMAYHNINNLFLYHFYYLYELIFVTWYFTKFLIRSAIPWFYIITGAYTVFWLIDIIMWEPLDEFCSMAVAFQKILLLLQCMYFLLMVSRTDIILRFQRLPEFWIASAFLVSAALGVLAVVAYKSYEILLMSAPGINTWLIEVVATMFKFVFLTIAFLCYKRPRSHYQSPLLL